MNIPIEAKTAKKGYIYPGAVGLTFCTSTVATRGLNAEAVQCAKSYPKAADVSLMLGGNFSTSQAKVK
jgi:hypothetical protein